MNEGGEIARVASYEGLRRALAARRRALGLTQEALNELAGLHGGYVNKLEVGIRKFGDMSLDAVLGALDLEIVLMRAVSTHPGNPEQALGGEAGSSKKNARTRQQKGGHALADKMTPAARSASALRAARARWKRHFKGRRREARPKGGADA